jgi:hemoglobin
MAENQTLFERLGGAPAITAVVDAFYTRVLADPELEGFFRGVSIQRLRGHQVAFLSAALNDRAVNLAVMERAHAGRGIRDSHFDRVAGHLVATLLDVGVPQAMVDEVVGRVAPLRGHVVEAGEEAAVA